MPRRESTIGQKDEETWFKASVLSIAAELEHSQKQAQRLRHLASIYLTPYQAVVRALLGKGYSPTEIQELVGIPRPKAWGLAKQFGWQMEKAGRLKGRQCRACQRFFSYRYNYCPLCGKVLGVPKSWRTIRDAHGEVIQEGRKPLNAMPTTK